VLVVVEADAAAASGIPPAEAELVPAAAAAGPKKNPPAEIVLVPAAAPLKLAPPAPFALPKGGADTERVAGVEVQPRTISQDLQFRKICSG